MDSTRGPAPERGPLPEALLPQAGEPADSGARALPGGLGAPPPAVGSTPGTTRDQA